MPKLPRDLSAVQVVRAVEKAGFRVVRQSGSHMVLERSDPYAAGILPKHNPVPVGTLASFLRQIGMSHDEFFELLK